MNTFYKYILLLCITVSLFSCTKEISVDVTHDVQTVIFGSLNNQNEQVKIIVQQSVPLNSTQTSQPVNDATIALYERNSNGNSNLITSNFEINQGVYTSIDNIATTQGNSYWIEVTLANGMVFRSKEEVMQPVVAINEVTRNEVFNDILKIQFVDPDNTTNLYKATVKTFNENIPVSSNFTQSSDVLFDGNTQAIIEVDIFPELSEDEEDTNPFPVFNRLEVELANINFQSYQFLLNQSAQIEANTEANDSESGSPSQLFSTPPVSLLGNIINTSNNTISLGNFSVESIANFSLEL